jgi:hypothetical protein
LNYQISPANPPGFSTIANSFHVRFGSLADIAMNWMKVRFAPKADKLRTKMMRERDN